MSGVRTGTYGMPKADARGRRRDPARGARHRSVSPNIDGSIRCVHGDAKLDDALRGVSSTTSTSSAGQIAAGALSPTKSWSAPRRSVSSARRSSSSSSAKWTRWARSSHRGGAVRVVGVLAAKGQSARVRIRTTPSCCPYTTAKRSRGRDRCGWTTFCAQRVPGIRSAVDAVAALMRQRHRIAAGRRRRLQHPSPRRGDRGAERRRARRWIAAAERRSVTLLVGGIGIMNVMLVSVAQRTREIGSPGVGRRSGLRQFLARRQGGGWVGEGGGRMGRGGGGGGGVARRGATQRAVSQGSQRRPVSQSKCARRTAVGVMSIVPKTIGKRNLRGPAEPGLNTERSPSRATSGTCE